MKASKLIELLRTVPGDRHVKVATQNPKYPSDIGMDNMWMLRTDKKLSAGTKYVVLLAKRKSSKQLKLEKKLRII